MIAATSRPRFGAQRGRAGTAPSDGEIRKPVQSTSTLVQRPPAARPPAGADGPFRGVLVLERYRVLERLGAGGFGVVWRARDELLGREVALKRVPLAGEGHHRRATREALAAARLAHPAIVALYEACADGDAFYLISELVRGVTLDRLARDEPHDLRLLEIGLALADALGHAHYRGVIHRDVKPQNVLIPDAAGDEHAAPRTPLPAAKLTDFGGARLAGEDVLTRSGDVMGTLAYMAPEQVEGGSVGADADLYSLALVLYEAFCGTNPVRGPSPAATVRRIGSAIEPLERVRGDLPRAVARALDRALAPAPEDRGSLAELRAALAAGRQLTGADPTLRQGRGGSRARTRDDDGGQRERRVRRFGARADKPPRRGARAPATAIALEDVRHRTSRAHTGGRAAEPGREDDDSRRHGSAWPPLPRAVWIGLAAAAVTWQGAAGRPGAALVLALALAPLVVLARRADVAWLAAALAPILGVVRLAGAFPAIAGQGRGWRLRAMLGALGYWWLVLAEPLLGRHLWLGQPAGAPPHGQWETSLHDAAVHVAAPLLGTGVLLGAALWAGAAVCLPWLVRGRRAALDVVAATMWSAAVAAAAPSFDRGLSASVHAGPRGAVLGAVCGGMVAVAVRALRGPV